MLSTEDLVAAAHPLINDIGSGFYFTPEALAVGREYGLDGYRFYFLGRGGVLGDVEPAVVASAFGYFHPALVERMWTSGLERSGLSARQLGQIYLRCCHEFGRRHLGQVSGLDAFCEAASVVNSVSDRAGLTLYAAIAAQPLPSDLPARAVQLAAVLREFRGSAHLVAVTATDGIDPLAAHAIRRPESWTLFGHDEDSRPQGTAQRHAALIHADTLTDRLVMPAFDALDADARNALLDGLTAIQRALPQRATASRG
ncbi:SCO6745 family protein [Pseudonocardia acaciae]|uniref:SCO6745 family protein n=1 Tax=Pseudonocardia acaciae TaxID=551276 RepID=UPI000688D882|nr:hypothetical protein [Pseudonocardia acaciae]